MWQWTPFMMLILLGRPAEPAAEALEAARIDGATAWQIFAHDAPAPAPVPGAGGLLGSIYLVQTFDAVFTITQGGPGTATTNLPYEIYLTIVPQFEYGRGCRRPG